MIDYKTDKNTIIFQKAVKELKLRFPVKEISERMNYDKGNISNFIKGKKTISDNFLDNFFIEFNLDKSKFEYSDYSLNINQNNKNGDNIVDNKNNTLLEKELELYKKENDLLKREMELLKREMELKK
ncbi:MAG: hypothetical protein KGV59_06150 [Tenacibaculum sp.]|nr:hypothetical protein [Tenacibaculum sp.]